MKITWRGSPNKNDASMRKPIDRIITHWFGIGTLSSADNRFKSPTGGASAHYGISDDTIYQWVKEEEVAWHAGDWPTNQRSIGIEHDATTTKNASEKTYQTSGLLVRAICERHNIPIDRKHIIGHNEVVATQCPGTIDINKIIKLAKGDPMDFLKEDIPTEVEDKFKLKDVKRYNKHWTYEEFFKDWVNLVSEYDELKERSKKEALELTKRVSELDKVRVSLQKDINSLEANLMALEALRVKQGEESLEKHQELQKQYEEVSSAHEDLLEAYTNLQLDLDAGYADQISRLKKTIKDQERRILQLQRPKPSVGEAFELLIEALREAIIK
jgi:hypothetical protein